MWYRWRRKRCGGDGRAGGMEGREPLRRRTAGGVCCRVFRNKGYIFGIMSLYRDFLLLIDGSFSEASRRDIRKAMHVAVRALAGQRRYDGSPFVFHSVKTARIVAEEIRMT